MEVSNRERRSSWCRSARARQWRILRRMSWFPIAAIIGLVLGFSVLGMANLIDVAFRSTDPEVKGTVRAPAWATRVPRTTRGSLAIWVLVEYEWGGITASRNGFTLDRLDSRYGRSLRSAEALAASLNTGQSIPIYVSRRDPRNAELIRPKTASLLPSFVFLPGAYFFGRMWWYAALRSRRRSPSMFVAAMLLIPATLGFIDLALGSVLPPWLGLSVPIAIAGVLLIRACIFRYSAASPVMTPGR